MIDNGMILYGYSCLDEYISLWVNPKIINRILTMNGLTLREIQSGIYPSRYYSVPEELKHLIDPDIDYD